MTQPEPIGAWTFWADSSVSPYTVLGPVTCLSFTCQWQLSDFGSAEAEIPVDQAGSLTRNDLLGFFRWRLWALYNGTPVWAGLPTGLTDDGGASVKMSFTELPGYLLRKVYATTRTYTGVEQTTIAGDIAARLDNIGVPRNIIPGSGVNRDRTYDYLGNTNRGEMLRALTQVSNGPEFRADYAMTAGRPACTLKIAYPRVGAASGLAVIVPGGPVGVNLQWSSDLMRTRTFEVGDLPNNAATTAQRPVAYLDAEQAGLPELDVATDRPGIIVTSHLNELASTDASVYASPTLELTTTMPANAPALGDYGVGDDVALQLATPLLPAGMPSAPSFRICPTTCRAAWRASSPRLICSPTRSPSTCRSGSRCSPDSFCCGGR